VRIATLLLLVALAVAGCGDDGGGEVKVGGTVPKCIGIVRNRALSERFPRTFPLPPGRVVHAEYTDGDAEIAEIYIHANLDSARDYYKEQLPKHGFDLGDEKTEEQQAEREFDGHDLDGRVRLHTVEGCENAIFMGVVLRPAAEEEEGS
jgi:hypothetical protein